MIDKTLGLNCPDPAETYSNSPHVYIELDIPTDIQGSIGTPKKSPVKRPTSGGRNGDGPRAAAQQRPPATPHPRWPVGHGPCRCQRQRRRGRVDPSRGRRRHAGTASSPPPPQVGGRDGRRQLSRRRCRPMVKPERRTKADLLAATAIVAVVAAAAALIWWTSDARATISRPATGPAPSPRLAHEIPQTLKQLWTAPNAPTDQPVVRRRNRRHRRRACGARA